MRIFKSLKQFIRSLDLFSQQVSFRYNDQPRYQTMTGGFISLMLIAVFIGVFMTTIMSTFNKDQITYNLTTYDDVNPSLISTFVNSTFMFAVGLKGIDVNYGGRYFDFVMQFNNLSIYGKNRSYVQLQQCKLELWQSLGYKQTFQKLNLSQWLCPPADLTLQLQGKFTSDFFKYYKISVMQCNSSLSSRPCLTNDQLLSYLDANQYFTLDFYFVNTILNPGSQVYRGTYLQDNNYFPFSLVQGLATNLFISSYKVNTDNSLLLVQDIQTTHGCIVLNAANVLNYIVRNKQLVKVYLRKSPISIQIDRSFKRIDDMLSYIGGLFTSILSALGIITLYNEFSYEMDVAKKLFYYQKNDPINSDSFHLGNFCIYLIFILFDKINITLNWPKYQRFHLYLQQSRKQLDIRLVMKKILYSQRLGIAILDKPKYKSLHMQQPITLDEAKQIRGDYEIYQNLRRKYINQTSEDISIRKLSQQQLKVKRSMTQQNIFNTQNDKAQNILTDELTITNDYQQKQKRQSRFQKLTININPIIQTQQSSSQKQDQKNKIQFDQQMRNYLLKIKKQSDKGDKVAKRILNIVDQKLRKIYLPSRNFRKIKQKPIIIKKNHQKHLNQYHLKHNQYQQEHTQQQNYYFQQLSQQKFNQKNLKTQNH